MRRIVALDHHHDDDDEHLLDMPPTPVTRSVIRSSSVPPRLPTPRNALLTRQHHVIRTDSHVTPVTPAPPDVPRHGGVHVYGKVLLGGDAIHEPIVTVRISATKFYQY